MNKGLIFDIQRFSINDGPGIRTTIFFKGCQLKCKWCHNPESISFKPQLAYDSLKCHLCLNCLSSLKGEYKIEASNLKIDVALNEDNYQLVEKCNHNAYSIYGTYYTIEQLLEIILKDKQYYLDSNGGVTLSGGEALLQFSFIKSLCLILKKHNISIALDTNGLVNLEHFKLLKDNLDYILLDFKIQDPKLQIKYLNQEVDILPIVNYCNDNELKIILRCPIIKNVNDHKEHFKQIINLSKNNSIKQVDLLAYHNLKKNKSFKLHNEYESFDKVNDNDLIVWKNNLKSLNKRLSINGVFY